MVFDDEDQAGTSWADEVENADRLPAPKTTGPDKDGIRTLVEWHLNEDGKRVRKTTRFKVRTVVEKVNKSVQRREKLSKFGEESKSESFGSDPSKPSSVTTVSNEDIFVERPQVVGEKKKTDEPSLKSKVNFSLLHERLAARKRGEHVETIRQGEAGAGDEEGKSDAAAGGGSGGGPAKYVPPSLRSGGNREGVSMGNRREENTLRVSGLADEVTEDDLEDLFRAFGSIQRIYLAKDRNTGESRGFAFVSYHNRPDAEKALSKLDNYGFFNVIMHVEWSEPRKDRV